MKLYRCHYCDFASPDAETTFGHMQRRECAIDPKAPEWVRRARQKRLPAKVLLAA